MTWPIGQEKASTQYVDNDTDSIARARRDIKKSIDTTNRIIDTFTVSGPTQSQLFQYNATSEKFEHTFNFGTSKFEFLLELDAEFATGTNDYAGGFTITGSNSTGVTIGNDDSAGRSLINFPTGTYVFTQIGEKLTGDNILTVKFIDNNDNSLLLTGISVITDGTNPDIRFYKLPSVLDLTSDTDVYIESTYTAPFAFTEQHPSFTIARIA